MIFTVCWQLANLYMHVLHAWCSKSDICQYVFKSVANINLLQRPAHIIRRKRPFAVWFPYTTIERLLYQLEELIKLGHMVDQCDKLKKMLHGSLQNHLKTVGLRATFWILIFMLPGMYVPINLFVCAFQLKVDSDDAISVSSWLLLNLVTSGCYR